MTRNLQLLAGALLLVLAAAVHADTHTGMPLEVAVSPYLSTRALLATYQPLQQYLSRELQRPVLIVTAPDMRTFVARTQAGTYPYVITAPHFARFAQREAGYRPLLRARRELAGILLVAEGSSVRTVAELRGKTVATPDDLAIITRLGLGLLRDHGLTPGADVSLEAMPSHSSAALAVKHGAVAAAIVSNTAFEQMPIEQRSGLRVLARTVEVPHVMLLARHDMPSLEVERFVQLVREFVERTAEGRKFIDSLGYLGFRPPTEAELRSLDPYTEGLKAALTAPQ